MQGVIMESAVIILIEMVVVIMLWSSNVRSHIWEMAKQPQKFLRI